MTSPTANPTAKTPTRKKRGCLFWLGVTAGVIFVLVVILVGMLWYGYNQAFAKPEFYKRRDALLVKTGTAELDRIANEAEQRISNTITQPHTGANGGVDAPGTFELVLTFDQINAWLATRFNSWANHQGTKVPPSVKGVMMTQEGGDLIFASEVDSPQFKGVISMKLHVELVEKGSDPSLMIKLVSVQSGNVPVAGWAIKGLFPDDGSQSQEAQKWLDLVDKGYKVPATGTLDPKSKRQLRLDELEVTAEGIRMKMTEMSGRTATQPGGAATQGPGAVRDADQP